MQMLLESWERELVTKQKAAITSDVNGQQKNNINHSFHPEFLPSCSIKVVHTRFTACVAFTNIPPFSTLFPTFQASFEQWQRSTCRRLVSNSSAEVNPADLGVLG